MAVEPEDMAYIGRATCGCIRLAMVDSPERKRGNAREVSQAIREGYAVERVTCEYVRTTPWTCDEHAEAKQGALL